MAKGAVYELDGVTVKCTNVDRVVFPEDGITKGDVIDYYRDLAPVMLPEVRERALSIERYVKGLAGPGFFQKHAQKHYPEWLDREELGIKTRVVYPVVNTAAGLVYMANQGAIAMHIWTSRRDTPDYPDQIVFDLDPPDGGFEMVRKTALILKDLFDQLELPAFVKTSGSKGLHVVAPTDGRAPYTEAVGLCNRMVKLLCARHPDLVTTEFYKKDRKGRLFLDVLRNAHGATFVAAYSLRGRNGAPVSAPIEWEEVDDPRTKPNGFGLRDMRARLDNLGDPWSELRREVGSIDSADAALDRLIDRD